MVKTPITICTFNVENLFTRYKVFGYLPNDQFKRKVLTKEELEKEGGFLPGQMYKSSFKIFDKGSWRKLTAKSIKGYGESKGENSLLPDILCMQEVDSMDALRLFNEGYLDNYYDHAILLDSHDPRRIDVGVLSRYKANSIVTNMYEPHKGKGSHEYLFSRDCLEVSFEIPKTKGLTIFLNHLKSKLVIEKDPVKKKKKEEQDNSLRLAQANKVMKLVSERFPAKNDAQNDSFNIQNFVILGDFNDTPNSAYLKPLLKNSGMENAISRLEKEEQWTHLWDDKRIVSQIDYILLSPNLSKKSPKKPYIERRGLTKKIKTYCNLNDKEGEKIPFDFPRFTEVSDKIEASDHCPVFQDLVLE